MVRQPGSESLFNLIIPGLKFLSLEVTPVVCVRVRLLQEGDAAETWSGQEGPDPEEVAKQMWEAAGPAAEGEEAEPVPVGRVESTDVVMTGPCVLIQVVAFRLEGKTVEELNINDLFVNQGTTCFRWRSRGDGSLDGPDLQRLGPEGDYTSAVEVPYKGKKVEPGQACMTSWTNIGVGVDPPGPFALLPNSLTQRVGDSVLQATLGALQGVFLSGLSTDYKRWSSDPEYRDMRRMADMETAAEAAKGE